MLITAGQTVTWNGNLAVHPLDPSEGDTPNPIAGGGQTVGKVIWFELHERPA